MSRTLLVSTSFLALLAFLPPAETRAQGSAVDVPPVVVQARRQRPAAAARSARPVTTARRAARAASAAQIARPPGQPVTPAADAERLPSVVSGGPNGGPGSLTVPSVAQQRDRVNSTVGSVAFVDARSFENRYTNTITDTLRDTPGVFAQTRYGQEIRLSVRGSGVARSFHTRGIEILQDGIPFNFADGSGDYYQVDPLALRSVEVYKGGNALIFGGSTLGGAINFVTPTAYTAVAPAFVRLEGGTFVAIRTQVQASKVDGPADALISYTYSHQGGYRAHQNQDYNQFNGNFGYQVAPGVETRTYLGVYDTRQKLPGTLDLFNALAFPRQATTAVITGNQSRDVKDQRIANRTSFQLDVGQLDLDSWLVHKRLYHPIFQVIDQDGITYGVSPHWSGSFDIAGFKDDLTIGGRFFGGSNKALQFVNVAGQRGALTANARQDAANWELFVDNRFWLTPELALMAGAKLFHDERDFDNRFRLPFRTAERDYDGFNPKLGILYRPAPNVQFFADVTRSRDVPDFSDLAQSNPAGLTFVPLQQQKAWTGEIGTRGSLDRVKWDFTFYRSGVRDELLNFSPNAALGIPAATFNADRTVHQGIELAASVDLVRDVSGPDAGDTISVAQIWTYNDFHFVGDRIYRNNVFPVIPRNVLRTVLSYTRPDGFYVSPTLDIVPQGAFADYANTLRTPGYALFGIQTGFRWPNGTTIYVDARNLTNERYVGDIGAITDARSVSNAVFYPGEGRSVFAGVRYTF